jgi:hypothetical protein
MQERSNRINKQIAAQKLTASATVQPRYAKNISFKPSIRCAIAIVEGGAAGLTGGGGKPEKRSRKRRRPKSRRKGRFGLSKMLPTAAARRSRRRSPRRRRARTCDPEKDAKGGSNPAIVAVKIAAADVAAFRKEGGLP